MEPTNHPFGKENDLNQTSRELCSMLIFRGVFIAPLKPAIMASERNPPPVTYPSQKKYGRAIKGLKQLGASLDKVG